ncbi:MAG: hypothetical protein RDV41_12560, partial [Planctomycetota bacterium]|nr:hypothetical protein [Planctomycetota bacterium]
IQANLSSPSSIALKDTGTVPFCFRSYDVFSIEAIGVMNNPAGYQTASHTFREVLSIIPFGSYAWELKNRYDFSQMASRCGSSKIVFGPDFGVISTADWNTAGQTAGDLRVESPSDTRGAGISLTESFPGTYDGQALSGPAEYDFSDETIASPAPGTDILAGGIEMWVKPSGLSGGRVYFFDFAQSEFENRISLYYDGRDLVLTAADATVDTWESQVRHTVQLVPDTWYHLGAYWKSTYYGHLCLALDGMVVGTGAHVDQNGQRALGFLSSNTTETDTSISVTTTANFPTPALIGGIQRWGVIEIGNETIEYSGMSGTTFTNCVRGARGTTAASHVAGAAVTIYGYSNLLSTEGVTISAVDPSTGEPATLMSIDLDAGIPVVKGLLADSIGERPEATINKPASPPEPGGITAGDTTIPVAPNTDGFPTKGFIKIRNEVIYYDSKTSSSFEGCRRGAPQAEPTMAAPHGHGARIVMFAIPVTDVAGYPNPAIVQIDDEWIAGRPVIAQEDGGGYIMGWIFGGISGSFARPPFRGEFFETIQAAHSANVKVIPVFSVSEPECGKSDKVTIVTDDQTIDKEQMEIRNAKQRRTISRDVGGMTVQITISNLVGFMDFTNRAYAPDDINRLLKFPSGELASFLNDRIYVCGMSPAGTGSSSTIGGGGTGTGAKGTIDEIRFFSGPKGDFRLAQPLDAGTVTDLQMNAVTGIDANGGAVKIGDELIGFAQAAGGVGSGTLSGSTRGYLKTTAAVHDSGSRAFNLSFLGISALSGAVTAEASSIQLRGATGLPAAGYILVDNEVIGYTRFDGAAADSATAVMPMDMELRGMYRGAFGTDAAAHDAGRLAYAIPFRYWDRFSAHSYDSSLVRFDATIPVIDAFWKRIHWTEEHDSGDPNLDVHIKVRLDTCGEWEMARSGTTPPKRAQVFSFNEPIGKNPLNVRGNRAELRCLWEYKKGSFSTNSWKKTVFIGDIFVDYEAKTTSLSHRQMR